MVVNLTIMVSYDKRNLKITEYSKVSSQKTIYMIIIYQKVATNKTNKKNRLHLSQQISIKVPAAYGHDFMLKTQSEQCTLTSLNCIYKY